LDLLTLQHVVMLSVLTIVVLFISETLPLSAAHFPRNAADSLREYKTISRILRAVHEYMVVHRLVDPLEPGNLCVPDEAYASVRSLAAVPLDERPAPREGDIFLADVADLFRNRIARALRHVECNPPGPVAQIIEEAAAAPIAVNKPVPWSAGRPMSTWVVATLPALPEDLEYRLVGRNLALVDLRANIVVDILRDALPMF